MKKLFLLLTLTILACNTSEPNVPHPTPVVQDTDKCPLAEQKLKALGCISATEPYTKRNGLSFTTFCENLQNEGVFINPSCLADITSCSQMDVCTGTVKGN